MSRFISALAIVVLCIAGCASYPDVNRQRMESLPHHYSQFDAVLSWEVRPVGPDLVIDGYFRNIRFLAMENVEVWVAAVDPAGKTMARSVDYLIPRLLRENDIAPFSMKLRVTPVPGSKLRFTYKYSAVEGAGTDGGGDVGDWMQSFDAEIPTAPGRLR